MCDSPSNMPPQDRADTSVSQPKQEQTRHKIKHEQVTQTPDLHRNIPALPSQPIPMAILEVLQNPLTKWEVA